MWEKARVEQHVAIPPPAESEMNSEDSPALLAFRRNAVRNRRRRQAARIRQRQQHPTPKGPSTPSCDASRASAHSGRSSLGVSVREGPPSQEFVPRSFVFDGNAKGSAWESPSSTSSRGSTFSAISPLSRARSSFKQTRSPPQTSTPESKSVYPSVIQAGTTMSTRSSHSEMTPPSTTRELHVVSPPWSGSTISSADSPHLKHSRAVCQSVQPTIHSRDEDDDDLSSSSPSIESPPRRRLVPLKQGIFPEDCLPEDDNSIVDFFGSEDSLAADDNSIVETSAAVSEECASLSSEGDENSSSDDEPEVHLEDLVPGSSESAKDDILRTDSTPATSVAQLKPKMQCDNDMDIILQPSQISVESDLTPNIRRCPDSPEDSLLGDSVGDSEPSPINPLDSSDLSSEAVSPKRGNRNVAITIHTGLDSSNESLHIDDEDVRHPAPVHMKVALDQFGEPRSCDIPSEIIKIDECTSKTEEADVRSFYSDSSDPVEHFRSTVSPPPGEVASDARVKALSADFNRAVSLMDCDEDESRTMASTPTTTAQLEDLLDSEIEQTIRFLKSYGADTSDCDKSDFSMPEFLNAVESTTLSMDGSGNPENKKLTLDSFEQFESELEATQDHALRSFHEMSHEPPVAPQPHPVPRTVGGEKQLNAHLALYETRHELEICQDKLVGLQIELERKGLELQAQRITVAQRDHEIAVLTMEREKHKADLKRTQQARADDDSSSFWGCDSFVNTMTSWSECCPGSSHAYH